MGGAGKRGGHGVGGRGKGLSWVEVTSNRFADRGQPDVGKGKADTAEDARRRVAARASELAAHAAGFSRTGAWAPPDDDAGDLGTGEPVAPVGLQAAHRAALEGHRMHTGRRASGFEPQRNTFYICGRPVQVLTWPKQD